MTIDCKDLDQFMAVIAGLVQRGLGFKADAETLKISLTGAN
jgi:hypothetical protein